MKFKKLASLVLTGAMIASMSMSAFAFGGGVTPASNNNAGNSAASGSSSSSATGATLSVPSEVKTPAIDINVGTASAVIINPYKLKVDVDGTNKQDTFLSSPIVAENKSTTKVDVTAHVTITTGTDVVIVDKYADVQSATTGDPGEKNAYVVLAVADVGTTNEPKLGLELSDATPALKENGSALATGKSKLVTIASAGEEYGFGGEDDTDKKPLTIEAGDENSNYLAIQLFGEVNTHTEETWTANDTISASIVLTFKAQPLDVSNS